VEYRVEQLAAAAGIRVDTLRFYQARGLLHPPRRDGRVAIYEEAHLARLRRIRSLQQQGFTLAQIRKILERQEREAEPLLTALVEESGGGRTLAREELAAESGVPEVLLRAAQEAGLLEPLRVNGEERFGEADVELARAALDLLEAGFPIQRLLELAVAHAREVRQLCDAAIDLFDDHVRKSGPAAHDSEAIAAAFRRLLPRATQLVAVHFQRTLVIRALNRLRSKEQHEELRAALAATEAGRLEVEVEWR
jgi:DNA-binding transcriptional MerR regulator